jgi:hypothetical protein
MKYEHGSKRGVGISWPETCAVWVREVPEKTKYYDIVTNKIKVNGVSYEVSHPIYFGGLQVEIDGQRYMVLAEDMLNVILDWKKQNAKVLPMHKAKATRYRSKKTGKYVSAHYGKRNPTKVVKEEHDENLPTGN